MRHSCILSAAFVVACVSSSTVAQEEVFSIIEPERIAIDDAFAVVGDINGDGTRDLATGSPTAHIVGLNAGAVIIRSGVDGSELLRVLPPAGVADQFGATVDGLGDVDGDGVKDLMVGGTDMVVLSGADYSMLFHYPGTGNAAFGPRGGELADLDGDGNAEFAILTNDGTLSIFAGLNATPYLTLVPGQPELQFGDFLVQADDLNGDLIPDLVTSDWQPSCDKSCDPGIVYAFSGLNGSLLWSTAGISRTGEGLLRVNDQNSDGVDDIIALAVLTTELYCGATGAFLGNVTPPSVGDVIADIGDFNSDGTSDIYHQGVIDIGNFEDEYFILSGVDLSVIHSGTHLAIGSVFAPAKSQGAFYAFHRFSEPSVILKFDLVTGSSVWALAEPENPFEFGSNVLVHDLDQDGQSEVVVAAPSVFQDGRADAYTHDGNLLWQIPGSLSSKGELIQPWIDLDLDGWIDLLVPFVNIQEVRVISGKTGATLRTHTGGFGFANAVIALDDLNGDGVSDYAISGDHDTNDRGAISIFNGATGNLIEELIGEDVNGRLGMVMAAIDDVDRDGVREFAAGQLHPLDSGLTRFRIGVFSGATRERLAWMSVSTENASRFSVANAGDVDGDGFGDIIAGAARGNDGGANPRVKVYSGATLASIHLIEEVPSRFSYGSSVAGVGDVNGDGFDDYAVSDPLGPNGDGMGSVDVYSGRDHGLLDSIAAPGPDAQFGTIVRSAGHFEGRASQDLIIGAPDYRGSGAVFVYKSSQGGNAGFINLGPGHPGTGNLEPLLRSRGDLVLNGLLTMSAHKALPQTTGFLLVSGFVQPLPFRNGTLYPQFPVILIPWPSDINGESQFPLALGAGFPMPIDVVAQWVFVDPGASRGFSMTNGELIRIP